MADPLEDIQAWRQELQPNVLDIVENALAGAELGGVGTYPYRQERPHMREKPPRPHITPTWEEWWRMLPSWFAALDDRIARNLPDPMLTSLQAVFDYLLRGKTGPFRDRPFFERPEYKPGYPSGEPGDAPTNAPYQGLPRRPRIPPEPRGGTFDIPAFYRKPTGVM